MRLAEREGMSVHSSVATLAALEQPLDSALAQWKAVARCPSCFCESHVGYGHMPDRCYVFGAEKIAYPEQGITVACCVSFGLFYKLLLPTPAFLSDVFRW